MRGEWLNYNYLKDLPGGREGEHRQTHQQVGHRQVDNEEVRHTPQLVGTEDGGDDETIAANDQDVDKLEYGQGDQVGWFRPFHRFDEILALCLIHGGTFEMGVYPCSPPADAKNKKH